MSECDHNYKQEWELELKYRLESEAKVAELENNSGVRERYVLDMEEKVRVIEQHTVELQAVVDSFREVTSDEIACLIADKFPEYFDLESESYGILHRLEDLSKEIAAKHNRGK